MDDGDSDRGLAIAGTVEFNSSEGIWVVTVDWSQLARASLSVAARKALTTTPGADSPTEVFA